MVLFIHQIWISFNPSIKDTDIKESYASCQQSWLKFQKAYSSQVDYHLWKDTDCELLLRAHYPHLLRTYESYPNPICKVDLMRLIILDYFGGLYVDMDVELKAGAEQALLQTYKDCPHLLFQQAPEGCRTWWGWTLFSLFCKRMIRQPLLNNSVLYAPCRHHPIIQEYLYQLPGRLALHPTKSHVSVLQTTGPFVIQSIFETYPKEIHLLPHEVDQALFKDHGLGGESWATPWKEWRRLQLVFVILSCIFLFLPSFTHILALLVMIVLVQLYPLHLFLLPTFASAILVGIYHVLKGPVRFLWNRVFSR